MSLEIIVSFNALLIGVAACATDIWTRRIPNALTLVAALAGLLFHVFTSGVDGALTAAGGWGVGLIMLLPFFALGGMGGGDVKLMAALGAWLGPQETLWLAAYAGLAGGVLGVTVALARGYLRTALSNVVMMFGYWSQVGMRPVPGVTLASPGAPRLAYAIPILVGTVVTIWL
jgi:prepilin peptidase CpaA